MNGFDYQPERIGDFMIGGTGVHQRKELRRAIAIIIALVEECPGRAIQPDCESALAFYERWATRKYLAARFRRALAITDPRARYHTARTIARQMQQCLPLVYYKEGGG